MRAAEKRSQRDTTAGGAVERRSRVDNGHGLGDVRDEVAGLPGVDDLAHRTALERDHRRAAHHRLDDRQAERLGEGDRVQERGCAAENLRASAGADRAEVRDPVSVDPRLDALVEVRLVLDDAADDEPAARVSGDLDRLGRALVGVDAAEGDEGVTTARIERKLGAVDAVVDVGHVVEFGGAIRERDRDERRARCAGRSA